MKVLKSFLRHLLGALLTAGGIILSTPAGVTLKSAAITLVAAAIPVVVKYVDPTDDDFGLTNTRAYTEEDALNHLKD